MGDESKNGLPVRIQQPVRLRDCVGSRANPQHLCCGSHSSLPTILNQLSEPVVARYLRNALEPS